MEVFTTINDLARAVVDRLAGSAGAQLVFGEAHEVAGRTVIPVAHARYSFGVGAGGGTGRGPEQQGEGSGGGGGGGGMVMTRPVGFIEITGDRATFVPTIDYTRVILAALFCATAIVVAVMGPSRGRFMMMRGLRRMSDA